MKKIIIDGDLLTLESLEKFYINPTEVVLSEKCHLDINNSSALVEKFVKNKILYGINTGFGLLANTKIPQSQLEQLQKNIVLSHAAGVGELLSDEIVALIMLLKINALAQGYSGVRLLLIETLIVLLNAKVYPCIPSKGSVGASGDLAPFAHMSCVLLGEGEVRYQGKIISAQEGLKIAKLSPFSFAPKEGLALLNGTQVSTAIALSALFNLKKYFLSAIVTSCLSVDAFLASNKPFNSKIHQIRRQQEQQNIALWMNLLLEDSEILLSHHNCERVQDPYSFRCNPQVMGACLSQIKHAAQVLENEANAVTDNPLIFVEQDDIISGGNFHAEPVAMVADNLALAICEIGAISERRVSLLIDPYMSKLPACLVKESGINSGFMLAQVTAAALVSENKSRAYPCSVDSISTSANQEDHVSMATHSAYRLLAMNENLLSIIAIEYLAATQGIDFHQPLKTSQTLQLAHQFLRKEVSHYEQDRYFADDIKKSQQLINKSTLADLLAVDIFE